jgi:hypothetical protein
LSGAFCVEPDNGAATVTGTEHVASALRRAGERLLAHAWNGGCMGRSCGLPVDVCWAVDMTRRPPLSRCPIALEGQALQEEMRATFRWMDFIGGRDDTMIRRILAGRAMVSRGVHLNSWCRLGRLLRVDVRAVRQWHEAGLALIVSQLGGRV